MRRKSATYYLPDLTASFSNPYEQRPLPLSSSSQVQTNPTVPDYEVTGTVARNSAYAMKIVVVGDGGCGKTCLLVSYAQQRFTEIYVPTIFENYVTTVRSPQGKLIDLALWDTADQEDYDRLRPLSYPDADLILICFALDNVASLENVKDMWYPEIHHFCPGIPVVLVGTKTDLLPLVEPDLPLQVAADIGAIGYIQCSAKTMSNVKIVFNFALSHFQKEKELQEQVEKLQNRLSRMMGQGPLWGHSRNSSSNSYKKGHLKNASSNSNALLDAPLTEDNYDTKPYMVQQKYNDEEFAFTRKIRSRRCTIL
ncbi:ras-domain-containing protein [Metschnikowia bicuspidata]|uniref:Ras-domain-containing protein n=1 Tax=Metschnikowia bicuspidata TaxID=27322 RepID=A0A4P9ZDZ4_9ASCO|nr:ras-domain-containing protein [Metschnikowia bicuspidata]